jgi:DNA-binding phage protein
MMPKSRSYEQELIGYLQDPEWAVAYLNAALEEEEFFLVALQNVVKASGINGISQSGISMTK